MGVNEGDLQVVYYNTCTCDTGRLSNKYLLLCVFKECLIVTFGPYATKLLGGG